MKQPKEKKKEERPTKKKTSKKSTKTTQLLETFLAEDSQKIYTKEKKKLTFCRRT